MSELVRRNHTNTDELNEARRLRRQAEFLEQKARIKARLRQLMELSEDPYYDQYLAQMMKDLESGKATPEQVERETERSYYKYRQRMLQIEEKKMEVHVPHKPAMEIRREKAYREYRILLGKRTRYGGRAGKDNL